MNKEFDVLCIRCPYLKTLLRKQRKEGLPKKTWLAVMRLFIDTGRIALAREFSEQSEKHNYESDEIIDELSLKQPGERVRCKELGCITIHSDTDEVCAETKNIQKNEKGEIINSPHKRIRLTDKERIYIGYYPEMGINPNIYARYVTKNYRLMRHTSGKYYIYRGNSWKVFNEFKMKKVLRSFFHKFVQNKWRTSAEFTYMSAIQYESYDIDELESAESYINVKNGLLDLSSEQVTLMPHDKMVFSTTQIPIIYDETAKCPKFKKFLKTIFKGDKELIALVQEIMGYCLSNSVRAHKMFIFLGEGANGKSVLCEIMTALAGGIENVSSVALKDFGHKFSLSQIADKTLNISTENETDTNLDTQLLKAITSGEPVQMEEKFQSPFTYKPYVKLVFAMNSLPYTKDRSEGFERRLIIIPFDMRAVDGEPQNENEMKKDPYLTDGILKGDSDNNNESELSGILAFALRGLKRLRNNDYVFTESKRSLQALEEYKEKLAPMLIYVRSCITADAKAEKINMTTFREHFQKWCHYGGYDMVKKMTARTFSTEMDKILRKEHIENKRVKSSAQYISGIRVRGLNDGSYTQRPYERDIETLRVRGPVRDLDLELE